MCAGCVHQLKCAHMRIACVSYCKISEIAQCRQYRWQMQIRWVSVCCALEHDIGGERSCRLRVLKLQRMSRNIVVDVPASTLSAVLTFRCIEPPRTKLGMRRMPCSLLVDREAMEDIVF